MSLLEKRNAILESLHTQFKAKILSITLTDGRVLTLADKQLDRILLDVANNAAQGLADESFASAKPLFEACLSGCHPRG